jgi:hypothetical protein
MHPPPLARINGVMDALEQLHAACCCNAQHSDVANECYITPTNAAVDRRYQFYGVILVVPSCVALHLHQASSFPNIILDVSMLLMLLPAGATYKVCWLSQACAWH